MYDPINIKSSTKYGNNRWEVYSPKLGRNVSLYSDLEYDNWVTLECNPNVISFCEQPLKIQTFYDNKLLGAIFDMWVLYKDGKEEFQEVKYSTELNGNNLKSQRSNRQIEIQKQWCLENNYNFSLRLDTEIRENIVNLNNLKYIIGQVRNANTISNEDLEKITLLLSDKSLYVFDICDKTGFNISYVMQLISILIYSGKCSFVNQYTDFCLETEVELIVKD